MNDQFSQFTQQNDDNGFYQQPFRKRSYAADFRERARNALANRWLLAICAFLIASLLGAVAQSGGSFSASGNIDSDTLAQMLPTEITESMEAEIEKGNFKNAVDIFMDTELGLIIGIAVVAVLVISALFSLYTLFLGAPVMVGYSKFNIDLIDHVPNLSINSLFSAFRTCYWKAVGVRFLLSLISFAISLIIWVPLAFFTVAVFGILANPGGGGTGLLLLSILLLLLGCVVVVVLSIVITYRYALCYFILAEYPTLGVLDVLRNSATLMKGNKWRLFCLEISFIGWILLAGLTCGIGMLAVSPYMYAAQAAFYDELADRATAKAAEFPSLNPEDYYQNPANGN